MIPKNKTIEVHVQFLGDYVRVASPVSEIVFFMKVDVYRLWNPMYGSKNTENIKTVDDIDTTNKTVYEVVIQEGNKGLGGEIFKYILCGHA